MLKNSIVKGDIRNSTELINEQKYLEQMSNKKPIITAKLIITGRWLL